MNIQKFQHVTFTNPIIVDFLSRHSDNPDLLNACESLLESFCKNSDYALKSQTSKQDSSIFLKYVDDIDKRHKQYLDHIVNGHLHTFLDNTTAALTAKFDFTHLQKVPDALAHLKTIHELKEQHLSSLVRLENDNTRIHLRSDVNQVLDRLSKLEEAILRPKTTKQKGIDGEACLFDLLSMSLPARDGYKVEWISNLSYSCDILVKKTEYPDIRIESKAVGEGTNAKVSYKDVEKFERDLLHVNNHGILVSIHSAIVGVQNFEIRLLSNNKFAIYLANNMYDVSTIHEMIFLLYRLDKIIARKEDTVGISIDTMRRVQALIKDFSTKITSVKQHLKDSLAILTDIQFDAIDKLLLGSSDSVVSEFTCDICGKTYKTKQWLDKHKASH